MSGNLLEAVRRLKGISQTELARRANTYQASVSSSESGTTNPGSSLRCSLCYTVTAYRRTVL